MKVKRLDSGGVAFKIIAYSVTGIFSLLALYPVVYAFSASISGKMAYEFGDVVLFPKDVNFAVYNYLFNNKTFWLSYINTLFYTVFGTAWSMIISSCGAYALAKTKLLFRRQFNLFIVFTMWFSAGMIPTYLNYYNMGVNNRWGFVFAFGIQAFNIILLRSYFETIPAEVSEAAMIDGANEFQVFFKIYVPMSTAPIITVSLFYATNRWNGYFWANLLLRDEADAPLQVAMRRLIEYYSQFADNSPLELPFATDSYMFAILVCSIIPVLIIYPFIQKYFARGTSLGGVKG
ncbi:MAG: carbohydrate ABC transporter permease [Spirochaetaceae bacterium]|jgi:putative aldouronate transport system permease protein|nr:carbohydrate ABC transporter permease [Spirochaetaceae bacterium]